MGKPTYYSEGSEPRSGDPIYKIWTKILGKIQDGAGADAANDPRKTDSLWTIRHKVNKALNEGI